MIGLLSPLLWLTTSDN